MLTIFLATTITNVSLAENHTDNSSFYVGVTYGGGTVEGAKLLIDTVKDYTNLFILASGELQQNPAAIEEIGDYAIASGLYFAPYFGISSKLRYSSEWVDSAQQRWGNRFLGVYFFDEPGGKLLDVNPAFLPLNNSTFLSKSATGDIEVYAAEADINYKTLYYPNGTLKVTTSGPDKSKNGTLYFSYPDGSYETIYNAPWQEESYTEYPNRTKTNFIPQAFRFDVTYYPNGDITVFEPGTGGYWTYTLYTSVNGSERISQVEPLSAVLARNALGNDVVAQAFEAYTADYLQPLKNQSTTLFTSDYGLYWWDFRSGYDLVLAQLGWNNTIEQEIALVRGAANLQDKHWGTILTWKYTHPPFLADGQAMFEQMKTSYEAGAEYVVVFNYSEDPKNPNTLQDEHFQALERFWVEVVQNPEVVHGSIHAEAALVLPRNFGWGMRNPKDTIWGLWDANDTCRQIWSQVQTQLNQYGLKLDIVYEDPDYPVAGRYNNIYYVTNSFSYVWLIAAILLLPIVAGVLLVYLRRRKTK
jgi:hypothetical protein